MITPPPPNFWLWFGGIWLSVGVLFLIVEVSTGELPLFGGVLTAVGGVIFSSALKKRKLEKELRRRGMSAEATITEIAPAHIRINRVQQWNLNYRYQDAYGAAHTGAHLISPEEAPQWRVGQTVTVRYDSRHPHTHIWIGAAA